MMKSFSQFLDQASTFLAARKGLLPLIGIILVCANFLLRIFATGWMVETDFLLHLGVVLGLIGFMVAWAL